jgi:LacI family transcriptional regulator
MNRVTIADVARVAGVSLKSVSRVINNEANVSPSLKAKVDAAVKNLGFVPNLAARSLAGARSFTLGILFDNPSPNYTMKLLQGAYVSARARGYTLQFDNVDSGAEPESVRAQIEAILANARLDGMILTPPTTDSMEIIGALEARGIPIVRIAPLVDVARTPQVWIDDREAAAQVFAYLYGLGHRRFGLLNGHASHGSAKLRREGFLEAAEAAGCAVREEWGEFDFLAGMAAARRLLEGGGLEGAARPSAIFATNDDMAAGVYSAANQLGLHVPDDVSVVGFDDSIVARTVWPELTTVYQPITEMARAAVEMLCDRAADTGGGHVAKKARKLEFELLERASTAVYKGEDVGRVAQPMVRAL